VSLKDCETPQLQIDRKCFNSSGQLVDISTSYDNIAVCGVARFGDNYGYLLQNGQYIDSIPSGWETYIDEGAIFMTDSVEWGATDWGSYTPYCTGDSYLWAFNFSSMKGTALESTEFS